MKRLKRFGQLAAVAALAAGVSLPASALTIDLTSGPMTSMGGNENKGAKNFIKYTNFDFNSDLKLKMRARGYSNTSPTFRFQRARVFQDAAGLGACNKKESGRQSGGNCDLQENQLDNTDHTDLIAFFFNQSVSFKSVLIDPFQNMDGDISYWVGNVNDGHKSELQTNSYGYPGLVTNGFSGPADGDYNGTGGPLSINLTGTGNALLISASLSSGGNDDAFQITTLDVTPVPLPAAVWLMMSGLAAYGFTARKRKASV